MLTITALGTSSAKIPLEACVYQPHDIDSAWDLLEPFFQRVVDVSDGRLSLDVIRFRLLEGSLIAFATYRGDKLELVLTVESVQYPGLCIARIFSIAGKGLKEASRFLDALEAWALTQGAVEIEGWCRPAMARLASRLGWTAQRIIVSKDLRRRLQ